MDQLSLPQDLKDVRPYLSWEAMPVTNDAEVEQVGMYLKEIKTRLKTIEDYRLKVVGPIKQGISAFETMCREPTQKLKAIDSILRSKVSQFMDSRQKELERVAELDRQDKLKIERQKAAEATTTAMETDSSVAAQEVAQRTKNIERLESKEVSVSQTVRSTGFTMAQQVVWQWKVIDESKIPRDFLVVDEKMLNVITRGYDKAPVQIDGIQFYTETRVAIR